MRHGKRTSVSGSDCPDEYGLAAILPFLAMLGVMWTIPTLTLADDSFARIASGGILFSKTDDVRMLEETLEIRSDRIIVEFRFLNESDHDITTSVAFPLPPFSALRLKYCGQDCDHRSMMDSFQVLVDGQRLSKQVAWKAMVGDRDVTDLLRDIGLTDQQIIGPIFPSEDQRAALKKLEREGVLMKAEGYGEPDWQIHGTAYWQQTFPAGKEVRVEHSYEPMPGGTWNNQTVAEHAGSLPIPVGKDPKEACVDKIADAAEHWIKEEIAKKPGAHYVHVRDIEYVLSTGRNWKGPIEQFILRIDTGDEEEFFSLCFPSELKQIGSFTYEARMKDFVPPDKLVVYFYRVMNH
jgi:hypothetical protein